MGGLILIPTQREREILECEIRSVADEHRWAIQLCGFGPIAAASRTATLIAQQRPARVLLLGIAGGFGEALPLGNATAFDQVCCYGVGAGSGDQYRSAGELGYRHWNHDGLAVSDSLDLHVAAKTTDRRLLLTTPAASASEAEAKQKRRAVPAAMAEDMEGFAVALSCRLASVPLTIIRGISNVVGDRDHSHWQIEAALSAAAKLANHDVISRRLG